MTKEQRQNCPIALVAELVGDVWVLLILRDLSVGIKRFGDLQRSLEGISSRTLTAKLKMLEAKHIVERQAFRERPPRVEYALTRQGRELRSIINAMRDYGVTHLLPHA